MKRFLKELIKNGFLFILCLELLSLFIIKNFDISKNIGLKKEFQNIIELTKGVNEDLQSDTLVLGDSVGRQIYPTGVRPNYVTATGAILVHGNFILLKKALKSNPDLKVVKYIITPYSLALDMNYESTSSSYIKPFLSVYKLSDLTSTILSFLNTQPASILYLFNSGKFLQSDDILFGPAPYRDNYTLSEFAKESIIEMDAFCTKRNIELILLSPPIPDLATEKQRIKNFQKDLVSNPQLENAMGRYLSSIIFLPRNRFVDDLHFPKKDIRKNRKMIRELMTTKYNNTI